jgi:hypothetical protein
MSHAELCAALRISDATLRNWVDEATVARGASVRALDDLRIAVVGLHHAGLSGKRAIQWLLSRNLGRWTRGARPIDLVREHPLFLLAAVQDLLFPNEAEPPGTVHLRVQPPTPDAGATPHDDSGPDDDQRRSRTSKPPQHKTPKRRRDPSYT